MLEKVKNAMRIDGNEHDDELQDLISTAKALCKEVGILESKLVPTDDIARMAFIQYCKAKFGTDPKDSEKFMFSFNELRNFMSLTQTYTVEG